MPRSPFFYVGDKYKLINQLVDFFPSKINTLIEPFCGGGSVFLNVTAHNYVANDKNSYMIKLHKYLLSFKNKELEFFHLLEDEILYYRFSASNLKMYVPQELKKAHIKTYYAVYNKESYKKLKNDFNADKTNLLKLYLLLVYGFNHMLRFNNKGDFNLPVGNVDYNKNVKNALKDYFNFISTNSIVFNSFDFVDFLNNYNFQEGDFVYLDPPYLISNCEYNKGWTEEQDEQLLKILDKLNSKGIKFALSNVLTHKGCSNDKLLEWSKKYYLHNELKSNYISYHDNTIKNTVEVLITNF